MSSCDRNFHCSDQVDPFNRQALSLDMVIPHTELKAKISEWLDEQIKGIGSTQTGLYNHKKMARGFKFWIKEVEGLYYLCSENKCADQLRVITQLICTFVSSPEPKAQR